MIPKHYEMIRDLHTFFWWYVGRRDLFLRLLRKHLPVPVPRAADIGCGPGGNALMYGELACRWTCMDVEPSVFFGWEREAGFGGVSDVNSLPIKDGSLDLILLLDVLEHLEDEGGALREIGRSLSEGGLVLVAVPALMALWSRHDEQAGHQRRYRLSGLRRIIEGEDFEILDSRYYNFTLSHPIWMIRKVLRLFPDRGEKLETDYSPGFLNGLFVFLLRVENALTMKGFRWPWGTTAVILARKRRGEVIR